MVLIQRAQPCLEALGRCSDSKHPTVPEAEFNTFYYYHGREVTSAAAKLGCIFKTPDKTPNFRSQSRKIINTVMIVDKIDTDLIKFHALKNNGNGLGYLKLLIYTACVAAMIFGAVSLGGWKGGLLGVGFYLGVIIHSELSEDDKSAEKVLCERLEMPNLIEKPHCISLFIFRLLMPFLYFWGYAKEQDLKMSTIVEKITKMTAVIHANVKELTEYFATNYQALEEALLKELALPSTKDQYKGDLVEAYHALRYLCTELGIRLTPDALEVEDGKMNAEVVNRPVAVTSAKKGGFLSSLRKS